MLNCDCQLLDVLVKSCLSRMTDVLVFLPELEHTGNLRKVSIKKSPLKMNLFTAPVLQS